MFFAELLGGRPSLEAQFCGSQATVCTVLFLFPRKRLFYSASQTVFLRQCITFLAPNDRSLCSTGGHPVTEFAEDKRLTIAPIRSVIEAPTPSTP
ncbi:hypothetical protein [Burkholderia ubonensis]|uniref:hypothetical protein n=1 Tax=Burkholderia ubonensis TaxID=101571 RepID=UPI0018DF18EE|nr:hypothetical protein [Burkholderia ubonensis]